MGREVTVVRRNVGPGVTMVADVSGHGEPVVFLHGIPGSRAIWRSVVAGLGNDVQAVVPDLLGFGDSPDPPDDFHAPAQAHAVARLMREIGTDGYHLVGFDFGGPTAVALVAQHPACVRSLTLISTNAFPDTPIPAPLGLARVPVLGEALFHAMCSRPGLASMWMGAVGDKRAFSWRRFLAELPHRRGRRWTRRVFLDSLRHLESRYAPIAAALPGITCPTVVVWGDHDPFFPLAVGQRTAAAIPGARLEVLHGCGHFAPGERPSAVAALVQSQITRFTRG